MAGMDVDVFGNRVDELVKKGWLTRTGPHEAVTIEITGLFKKIREETDDE